MMMLCFIWSFFALYDNYTAGKEGEWDEKLDGHFIISGSICAHGEDDAPSSYQAWLNAAMAWCLLIIYVVVHIRHKDMVRQIDDDQISPPDFTIYIRNIPKDATVEEIRKWIDENALPEGKKPDIVKINLAFDIDEFVEYQRKYIYWRIKTEKSPATATCFKKSKEYCLAKVEEMDQKLENATKVVAENHFAGKAFITFRQEDEARLSLHYLTLPESQQNFWVKLRHLLCFYVPRAQQDFRGEKLIVQRPDEPSDILWENLGEKGAWRKRAITYNATFLILGLCGLVIYASS